jgi:hypothetical protein
MRNAHVIVFLALAASACAAKQSTSPSPSVVTGKAVVSSFPSTVSSVTATDELGHTTKAITGADGTFALPLSKGHTYHLAVATAGGSVPLVFPRTAGRIDATFSLQTDGAMIPLGNVRHLFTAPSSGFQVQSATTGSCTDCVNDDPGTTCENGDSVGAAGDDGSADPPDQAEQADPGGEMAVGDEDPPTTVEGCGGADGEQNDQPDPKEGED